MLVVSSKECWKGVDGWYSFGGFPAQMAALRSLVDEMELLVCEGPPRDGGIALPEGAQVTLLRRPAGVGLQRKLSLLRGSRYYVGMIRRHARRADLVHVPLPGDIPLLALIVAAFMRKRVIGRYGGSWLATDQTTVMNRVTRGAMRLLARKNVMFATGESASAPAKSIEWLFATALSQGELAAIAPDLDRGLASPSRLIYAGRLSEEKGVANLIRALALLKDEGFTPLPLVTLAGGGPQKGFLEALAESLGCRQQFSFVGQLARHELSRCFGQSDFCVQPSLTEGFSKAWLDAMAHGLPVLSSEAGAARSVIGGDGERGWLVPPGDPGQLARALAHAITSPTDWPALRRRCRSYVMGRTLDVWSRRIGEACAERWGFRLVNGKLAA